MGLPSSSTYPGSGCSIGLSVQQPGGYPPGGGLLGMLAIPGTPGIGSDGAGGAGGRRCGEVDRGCSQSTAPDAGSANHPASLCPLRIAPEDNGGETNRRQCYQGFTDCTFTNGTDNLADGTEYLSSRINRCSWGAKGMSSTRDGVPSFYLDWHGCAAHKRPRLRRVPPLIHIDESGDAVALLCEEMPQRNHLLFRELVSVLDVLNARRRQRKGRCVYPRELSKNNLEGTQSCTPSEGSLGRDPRRFLAWMGVLHIALILG